MALLRRRPSCPRHRLLRRHPLPDDPASSIDPDRPRSRPRLHRRAAQHRVRFPRTRLRSPRLLDRRTQWHHRVRVRFPRTRTACCERAAIGVESPHGRGSRFPEERSFRLRSPSRGGALLASRRRAALPRPLGSDDSAHAPESRTRRSMPNSNSGARREDALGSASGPAASNRTPSPLESAPRRRERPRMAVTTESARWTYERDQGRDRWGAWSREPAEERDVPILSVMNAHDHSSPTPAPPPQS